LNHVHVCYSLEQGINFKNIHLIPIFDTNQQNMTLFERAIYRAFNEMIPLESQTSGNTTGLIDRFSCNP